MSAPPTFYPSLKAAAEATGLSVDTMRKAVITGALKAKRSGKTKQGYGAGTYVIRHADLERWYAGLIDA